MRKVLIAFFICLQIAGSSSAQFSNEEIMRLKKQIPDAKHDSSVGKIFYDLAYGYRFSNIDSSLFYSDQVRELKVETNYAGADGENEGLHAGEAGTEFIIQLPKS